MKPQFAVLGLTMALGACGSSQYEPILDGPKSASYQRDLEACRQVAEQARNGNSEATAGAVAGAIIGALDAKDGDALGGGIGGAVVGGLLGSADAEAEFDKKSEKVIFNCLRGRGHAVVG